MDSQNDKPTTKKSIADKAIVDKEKADEEIADEEKAEKPIAAKPIAEELNEQTGVVGWQELVKHFARGILIIVDADLDLVDVAHSMSVDNTADMQKWLEGGTVRRANDEDAREWNSSNPEFWCMVVAPWVIVQKKGAAKEVH